MIDVTRIDQYREDNRIEAKKATGGLPESIWETYSAFANTLGGVILLGVEEDRNKNLHAVDLPDPQWLADEFLRKVNDPKIASANILAPEDIQFKTVDGNDLLLIYVPQAQPHQLPVYVGGDPYSGTYRRCGEGDIRCSRDEVERMMEGKLASYCG